MLITNSVSLEEMKAIHDGSFPLPDLSNRLYICRKTAVDAGKIVAVGLVRLTAEGILITNQELPKSTRARASAVLVEQLKQETKSYGLDECHVFVKNAGVQQFLEHLGFNPCQGGKALVIHF
jgi:hypothetical protein